MNTEIELKYQLSGDSEGNSTIVADITAMLKDQHSFFEMHQYQLNNDYFDNDNLDLRKIDFGLRIRTKAQLSKAQLAEQSHFEQTIKTAGNVVGSLHKRPEYNVDLSSNQLDLSLFPVKIWPENTNLGQLQQSLKVLFSTNFSRQTWLIHQDENIIELALDRGEIYTALNNKKCDSTLLINEIEIELVSGDEQALFVLAKQLMAIVAMTPSSLSKAARGYSLYSDKIDDESDNENHDEKKGGNTP